MEHTTRCHCCGRRFPESETNLRWLDMEKSVDVCGDCVGDYDRTDKLKAAFAVFWFLVCMVCAVCFGYYLYLIL